MRAGTQVCVSVCVLCAGWCVRACMRACVVHAVRLLQHILSACVVAAGATSGCSASLMRPLAAVAGLAVVHSSDLSTLCVVSQSLACVV